MEETSNYDLPRLHYPAIAGVLADVLGVEAQQVVETGADEDGLYVGDLRVVEPGRSLSVAVRVRRADCPPHYRHGFTIRTLSRGGGRTEMAKILEGYGDLLFYAHSDGGGGLGLWGIGDLAVFRRWVSAACPSPGRLYRNPDGTAFRVIRWHSPSPYIAPPGSFVLDASWLRRCGLCQRLLGGRRCVQHGGYSEAEMWRYVREEVRPMVGGAV